jgi:hypothetical protein
MTADEANEVLREVVRCVTEGRSPPLAWAVAMRGGRDVVAEAWDTAALPLPMLMLLSREERTRVYTWLDGRWQPSIGETARTIRRVRPAFTFTDVLAAIERGRQGVARP